MRKKRFLAIAAAIAVSISFTAPVTVSATEVEEAADMIDDEQEEGEQTTIMAPGAETEDSTSSGSSSGTTSSGGTGSSGSASSAKSSDSSLAHLGISPGSLSPAFSSGTHEYTATVDAGVTSISVAARPNNSKAVIASVSGAKSLSPGTNTVKVVVEAENGATSTYTITVNCGSSTAVSQTTTQGDTSGEVMAEDGEQVLEGEISAIDDTEEVQKEESEVSFDDNGYLIYEGNAYIPSSMMPEGEYVTLDKYNKLYEQAQTQKTKDMRLLIILVVVLVLLLIVILNLALKLRDIRQDVRLGLNGLEEDEEPEKKQKNKSSKSRKEAKAQSEKATHVQVTQTDTSMIPDVKMPEEIKPSKTEKTSRAERPAKAEKASKPEKASKSAKRAEDLEILDLNDL